MKILAMLVAAISLPAVAGIGSSVQLSGLSYELVDLRPEDGIAPSFKYYGQGFAVSNIFHRDDQYPDAIYNDQYVETPFGTTFLRAERGETVAATAAQSDGKFLSVSASGQASVPENGFVYYFNRTWVTNHGLSVELAPYTAMVWTGQYSLDAWVDPDPGLPLLKASASFSVLADETIRVSAGAYSDASFGKLSNHKEGSFGFQLANDSSEPLLKIGLISVDAVGQRTMPNPVPEPTTGVMMLAGLGAVMAWRQRRRPETGPASPV